MKDLYKNYIHVYSCSNFIADLSLHELWKSKLVSDISNIHIVFIIYYRYVQIFSPLPSFQMPSILNFYHANQIELRTFNCTKITNVHSIMIILPSLTRLSNEHLIKKSLVRNKLLFANHNQSAYHSFTYLRILQSSMRLFLFIHTETHFLYR